MNQLQKKVNFTWSKNNFNFSRDAMILSFTTVNNGDLIGKRHKLLSTYKNETQPIYIYLEKL